MDNEFIEENQEPIYDYEDCANMIEEKTGFGKESNSGCFKCRN